MAIRWLAVVLCFALGVSSPSRFRSEAPLGFSLPQELRLVRYALHIDRGKITGDAAPILQKALTGAQFVLLGEDHMTREIPEFAAAVCADMAEHGLAAMAVEAGPQVAHFVSSSIGKVDRLSRMAALANRYPDSVAFLNIRQENDLVERCAEAAHNPKFQIWGLDQEFLGSAGWLVDQILATNPGQAAAAELRRMKAEELGDAEAAKKAGDPSKLFLLAVSDAELSSEAALLAREGDATANKLFHELVESHEIYVKNAQGSPESNNQRARLLKQNFRKNLATIEATSQHPRVLVKFGEWHLYKGFNPLHQLDLGDYIAEVADGQGTSSLHICILGAKGTHRLYGGYDQPTKLEPFVLDEDNDYRWLKPAIDNQIANAWTLFDLRRLRFRNFDSTDPDMERLIYGYDILIIIPDVTPADVVK